jgi:hypothetical protein
MFIYSCGQLLVILRYSQHRRLSFRVAHTVHQSAHLLGAFTPICGIVKKQENGGIWIGRRTLAPNHCVIIAEAGVKKLLTSHWVGSFNDFVRPHLRTRVKNKGSPDTAPGLKFWEECPTGRAVTAEQAKDCRQAHPNGYDLAHKSLRFTSMILIAGSGFLMFTRSGELPSCPYSNSFSTLRRLFPTFWTAFLTRFLDAPVFLAS